MMAIMYASSSAGESDTAISGCSRSSRLDRDSGLLLLVLKNWSLHVFGDTTRVGLDQEV